jgi:hypothetical protein
MRKETVAEYMKRGGKVENLPYVKNYNIDYFSFGKVKPENGTSTKFMVRDLNSLSWSTRVSYGASEILRGP